MAQKTYNLGAVTQEERSLILDALAGATKDADDLRARFKALRPIPKPVAPSRSTRWTDAAARADEALSELVDIQQEFSDWKDNMPENLQNSPLGEKLEAVCDIDLEGAQSSVSEAADADLPLDFWRD